MNVGFSKSSKLRTKLNIKEPNYTKLNFTQARLILFIVGIIGVAFIEGGVICIRGLFDG